MDRTAINPLHVVRLLLVSGLFAALWIIFGAGSAHAADSPSTGDPANQTQPIGSSGAVSALVSPVKPLAAAVLPQPHPAPASRPASAGPAIPAPVPLPGGKLSRVVAPVSAATTTVTGTLSRVAPVVLHQTAARVTSLASGRAAPVAAPITKLAADAVQPLLTPAAGLIGGVLDPTSNKLGTLAAPVTGIVFSLADAPVSSGETLLSGVTATTTDSAPAAVGTGTTPVSVSPGRSSLIRSPGQPAVHSGTPEDAARPFPPLNTAGGGQDVAFSPHAGRGPVPGPSALPGWADPAAVPSPTSGGAGSQGASGAGPSAAAELSHRFILPVTRGGEGFLFSFVLPGYPGQEPGFSPG